MATVQKKTVLITGCSANGIGWTMAKVFRERGYYVFATLRDRANAGALTDLSEVEVLELDVTAPETIARCKETVEKRTGGTLDVLVNNAGAEFVCPLLDVDIAEAKKLYDVNVWGPLAMVQAFAPLLIRAKGIVANHGSIASVLTMVWSGAYASAKAAEARMSEVMRLELAPLGVRVVTVMVGSVNTPLFNRPGGRMKLREDSYYYGVSEHAYKQRMVHQGESMPVEPFAQQLVDKILGAGRGPIWYGTFATLVRFATWLFPQWYIDWSCNRDRGVELIKRP
ncbi:NADPH-dependent 1-acyldihydroxyacetone phosphate reductase [Madurella mycetomatis]|uniref:NADPH-dependent 1-acyldihydroxyacetone phosphate reductase n=1 Tax=Madurella mycetomatis TaxID=100816 RepID=A0A175WH46_9PEZI|nr:NADPH-dependent 1-acyldihydroxyacetone phosphate reductase [Madurella mycetomatis]